MVDRLLMIFERFASNCDPLFKYERRFLSRERVAFDGVGSVRQFNIIPSLQLHEHFLGKRSVLIELLLLS